MGHNLDESYLEHSQWFSYGKDYTSGSTRAGVTKFITTPKGKAFNGFVHFTFLAEVLK